MSRKSLPVVLFGNRKSLAWGSGSALANTSASVLRAKIILRASKGSRISRCSRVEIAAPHGCTGRHRVANKGLVVSGKLRPEEGANRITAKPM